ncbi:MAG: LysR family transcriptional regulator [Blautia sp.]
MNLAEVETFLMIVKTKNITKTAENLFLSQPTVSHRLKNLEEELQIRLITRKKGYKSIELTEKGEEFIPIAERWISLWREMQMLRHGQERMFLTVGCTDTLSMTIFSDLYRNIIHGEHSLDLRIKTHQSYEIYELLERHDIDVGFVYHHLHYKNIVAKPILKERMYLVQSGGETGEYKCRIHTDELDPENEIFFSWEADYQIWHDQWIGKIIRPRIQVDTFGLLRNLFTDGYHWMIAPASIIRSLREVCPVWVSELANETQPPERFVYQLNHKNPNIVTLRAVELFNKNLNQYLEKENWETIKI